MIPTRDKCIPENETRKLAGGDRRAKLASAPKRRHGDRLANQEKARHAGISNPLWKSLIDPKCDGAEFTKTSERDGSGGVFGILTSNTD